MSPTPAIPASQKIVILDLAPLAAGASSAALSSAAAMVDAVRGTRSHPLLKTTSVLASDEPTLKKLDLYKKWGRTKSDEVVRLG